MSAKFCIFIPAKIFQIEKNFPDQLQKWIAENYDRNGLNSDFQSYSLLTLLEFKNRPDVYLDLPEQTEDRYYVIDWGFYFPSSHLLLSFLTWLAKIYIYGEVGLLKYWSDRLRRFPPVRIGKNEESIFNLSTEHLPLDQLLFFPLKQLNE
jgi:hypothetical protein